MVVLDQDAVVQPAAMVRAGAGADGVFLERTERRRGLARVEDGDRAAGRVDETARQRGDAGEPLDEVQGGALRGQHRGGLAAQLRDDGARLAAIAVLVLALEGAAGIELQEGLRRDLQPRDDTRRLHDDDAAGAELRRNGCLGRDVAPAEILGERAPDDFAIQRRIERLERHTSHALRSCDGSGAASSTTT